MSLLESSQMEMMKNENNNNNNNYNYYYYYFGHFEMIIILPSCITVCLVSCISDDTVRHQVFFPLADQVLTSLLTNCSLS